MDLLLTLRNNSTNSAAAAVIEWAATIVAHTKKVRYICGKVVITELVEV